MYRIFVLIGFFFFFYQVDFSAQSPRINDHNTVGWFNFFPTLKLSEKMSIHTEYQARRFDLISSWQQNLLRFGLNYQWKPRVLIRVGYAWIDTYAYGEIPLNAFGKSFEEHRTYQMISIADKLGAVEFSHRFMLEQRWIGKYSSANLDNEDIFPLVHRWRYMMRVQLPFKGNTIGNKTPYLALYDEIFIGFGKNINANVFDQNRLGLLIGYKFDNKIRIEAGLFQQIVQYGRQIDNKNVFQYNTGWILNTFYNLDFSKKEE
jgi:Protein of unknown function (DUF2490)